MLPFAYLSFDRADLLPQQPLTLLAEAARQLGLLHPELAPAAAELGAAVRLTLLADHRSSAERARTHPAAGAATPATSASSPNSSPGWPDRRTATDRYCWYWTPWSRRSGRAAAR
ncbi:hypothetical protein ACFQ60_08405 [Streptomyces zhihengii]